MKRFKGGKVIFTSSQNPHHLRFFFFLGADNEAGLASPCPPSHFFFPGVWPLLFAGSVGGGKAPLVQLNIFIFLSTL